MVLKPQCATESPPVPDSVGLEWGLGSCISNKFRGAAAAAGLGSHFETHCPEEGCAVKLENPLLELTQGAVSL